MKERDLFSKNEPPKPLVREKNKPIVVDKDRDEIEERQVYGDDRVSSLPKKIREIKRRSKNAVVAWTPLIGWCVYAENEMLEQRAFYFREDVDDPTLSERCMRGTES